MTLAKIRVKLKATNPCKVISIVFRVPAVQSYFSEVYQMTVAEISSIGGHKNERHKSTTTPKLYYRNYRKKHLSQRNYRPILSPSKCKTTMMSLIALWDAVFMPQVWHYDHHSVGHICQPTCSLELSVPQWNSVVQNTEFHTTNIPYIKQEWDRIPFSKLRQLLSSFSRCIPNAKWLLKGQVM